MSISNIDKTCEEVEKLKKLADAMYYAAQYLTTDASRLHKAMDEYHQFIINEYQKEEPVSKVWYDSTKEQPILGSSVLVVKGHHYEILYNIYEVYKDEGRKWAYLNDLINL